MIAEIQQNKPLETQYIYKDLDRNEKARLIRQGEDWYVCETKPLDDPSAEWFPFFCGTAEYMALTDLDKKWAIDKRKRDGKNG
jgi:hypothetical protein